MTSTIENHAKTLGIEPNMTILHSGLPQDIFSKIKPHFSVKYYRAEDAALDLLPPDMFIIYRKHLKVLEFHLPALKCQMTKDGIIWLLYPKSSEKENSEVNHDSICKITDRFGLISEKTLELDKEWQAIKLVDNS